MHRANSVRHADGSAPHQQQPPAAAASASAAAAEAAEMVQQQQPHDAVRAPPEPYERRKCSHEQPGAPANLKSYFSDGDFEQVLIKVDDHDETGGAGNQLLRQMDTPSPGSAGGQLTNDEANCAGRSRRRSSCSDAEDSKRSSIISS